MDDSAKFNGNEPITPLPELSHGYGLTKREFMATHIMAGMLADPNVGGTADQISTRAVALTDALLVALEKETP